MPTSGIAEKYIELAVGWRTVCWVMLGVTPVGSGGSTGVSEDREAVVDIVLSLNESWSGFCFPSGRGYHSRGATTTASTRPLEGLVSM
jgi:hypothetical protein